MPCLRCITAFQVWRSRHAAADADAAAMDESTARLNACPPPDAFDAVAAD